MRSRTRVLRQRAGTPISGQLADARRSPAHCGQYRQAAGAGAQSWLAGRGRECAGEARRRHRQNSHKVLQTNNKQTPRLREALRGRIMKHHRFLLRLHLQQIDAIDTAVAEIDREVNERIEPFRITVELLTTIPGIGELAARIIAAEIGNDMSRFATAAHLVSWAGLCPRNDESAGKRRSTRMRHGAPWLKTTLIQCSWAAARKKGSYIHAQFHRIRSRRGAKKAIGAVAASILTAIYHMLKNGTCYQDLGPDHFDVCGFGATIVSHPRDGARNTNKKQNAVMPPEG